MRASESRTVPNGDYEAPIGAGGDMRLLYLTCNHKGHRTGGQFKGNLPWRCPACVKESK